VNGVKEHGAATFSATSQDMSGGLGQRNLSYRFVAAKGHRFAVSPPITTKSTDCACLEAIRSIGCIKIRSILGAYNLRLCLFRSNKKHWMH
jgi:hypothetical protein